MESVAYIVVLIMALAVLFFAIAFREPPVSKSRFRGVTSLKPAFIII
ncbi:Photosystem II protein PsbT [Crocosphaera watsonii WH 0402]|uniref:Photosystem II protein PsbT n=2 Tax=Crocosphaera watsonii TaxID=263511 RepID=T2JHQ1_CROWT|nr:hypothetical protein CWATWH0005_1996 [Crocosphaera watsonii WH 0005]CCQ64594.1 Photosystem II protein PsbT [Crocosphaera watsonii WH 0402]